MHIREKRVKSKRQNLQVMSSVKSIIEIDSAAFARYCDKTRTTYDVPFGRSR
jgi:hypothetical protein